MNDSKPYLVFFHLNTPLRDHFPLNPYGDFLFCFTVLYYVILWIYSDAKHFIDRH